MAANTSPVFPLAPASFVTDFSAKTACTTRAPTASASLAAANIFVLVPPGASQSPVSTAGTRIDYFKIKGSASSFTAPTVAQTLTIWKFDGTTAYPVQELQISAQTPSTTSGSFESTYAYTGDPLPVGWALYASTSITTTAATTAFVLHAEGGTF